MDFLGSDLSLVHFKSDNGSSLQRRSNSVNSQRSAKLPGARNPMGDYRRPASVCLGPSVKSRPLTSFWGFRLILLLIRLNLARFGR